MEAETKAQGGEGRGLPQQHGRTVRAYQAGLSDAGTSRKHRNREHPNGMLDCPGHGSPEPA